MASRTLASIFLITTVCTAFATATIPFAINRTALRQRLAPPIVDRWLPVKTRRSARYAQDQPLSADSNPFYANYSLVGMELDCSDSAKACLAINRLLHDASGRCYPLGDKRPCQSSVETLILDLDAFRQGRIVGTCRYQNTCDGFVMAYDGKCYSNADIGGKLCLDGSKLVPHPFGGYECLRKDSEKLLYQYMDHYTQYGTPGGRCKIPTFRTEKFFPMTVQCSAEEAVCLGKSLLPFQGRCYPVLAHSPCAYGNWLALDERPSMIQRRTRLFVICKPIKLCGPDAFMLRNDRACHSEIELREKLCPGDHLVLLPNGMFMCSEDPMDFELVSVKVEPRVCQVTAHFRTQEINAAIWGSQLECASNNDGECQPKVMVKPSYLSFDKEDRR